MQAEIHNSRGRVPLKMLSLTVLQRYTPVYAGGIREEKKKKERKNHPKTNHQVFFYLALLEHILRQ